MRKEWSMPAIEMLSIERTMNNVVVYSESDGIYAGDLGPGSPDGYICEASCS